MKLVATPALLYDYGDPRYLLPTGQVPAVCLVVIVPSALSVCLAGALRVFSAETSSMLLEIAAHSRYITALDLHPREELVRCTFAPICHVA